MHLATPPQQLTDLILDDALVLLIVELRRDPVVEHLRMEVMEGGDRHVDHVVFGVLAPAKRRLLLLLHADHGKRPALHRDRLADRAVLAEKVFGRVVPEHRNVRRALLFSGVEVAALQQREVVHVGV